MKNKLSPRQIREAKAARARRDAQQRQDGRARSFRLGVTRSGMTVRVANKKKPVAITRKTRTTGGRTLQHPPIYKKGKLLTR